MQSCCCQNDSAPIAVAPDDPAAYVGLDQSKRLSISVATRDRYVEGHVGEPSDDRERYHEAQAECERLERKSGSNFAGQKSIGRK